MLKVLVTCGGGFQGLTVLKMLKNVENVTTYLFDSNEDSVSRYFTDYFFQSTLVSESGEYKKQLYEVCRKNGVNYIIPATSYDLRLLAQLKSIFFEEIGCSILVPDTKYVTIFNDKIKSYSFLSENNIPTQQIIDSEEINKYPLLLKQNTGWGGKGIQKIERKEELNGVNFKESHLVEYFPSFEEFSIDFFINDKGELVKQVIRKRKSVSSGFATITNSNVSYDTKYKVYLELIKKAFERKELSGFYNLQFLDVNGKCFFTDLNSRLGTSAIISNFNNGTLFSTLANKKDKFKAVKAIRYLDEKYIPYVDFSKIKAIVFDLDDTLISNKQFILDRCLIMFERLNVFDVDIYKFKVQVLALLNEGKAPYLIDEICKTFNLESHKEQVLNTYRNSFPQKVEYFDDVLVTLNQLKERGLRLFVLTDNPVVTQKKKIEAIEYTQVFDKIYYTNEIGKEKPNKLCFDTVLNENELKGDEVLMVGDNEYRDVLGAIRSGYAYAFHIVRRKGMVSSSFFNFDLFKEAQNVFQIENLKDLLNYFNYYDTIQ